MITRPAEITSDRKRRPLVITPTRFALAIGFVGVIVLVAMLVGFVVNLQSFTVLGQVWITVGVSVLAIALVDHFQRRYEVSTKVIRVRRLFLWRTYELPHHADIVPSSKGQVLVRSEHGALILTFPREFSHGGELVRLLREYLAG